MSASPRLSLTLRINLDGRKAIGRGKIALLKELERCGSISAASRKLGISYRKTRLLVDDLNQLFRAPVIVAVKGGGATLSEEGREIIALYEDMQKNVKRVTRSDLLALEAFLDTKHS